MQQRQRQNLELASQKHFSIKFLSVFSEADKRGAERNKQYTTILDFPPRAVLKNRVEQHTKNRSDKSTARSKRRY
jgi:hypothetical protein